MLVIGILARRLINYFTEIVIPDLISLPRA
jgi:hypothetical protein